MRKIAGRPAKISKAEFDELVRLMIGAVLLAHGEEKTDPDKADPRLRSGVAHAALVAERWFGSPEFAAQMMRMAKGVGTH